MIATYFQKVVCSYNSQHLQKDVSQSLNYISANDVSKESLNRQKKPQCP